MDRLQIARYLKSRLLGILWPVAGGLAILKAGYVSDGLVEQFYKGGVPYCVVRPGRVTPDPELPHQRASSEVFEVAICHDAFANAAPGILGNTSLESWPGADLTKSDQRGQGDIEPQIIVAGLGPLEGFNACFFSVEPLEQGEVVGKLAGAVSISVARFRVEAFEASPAPQFDAVFRAKATPTGGGGADLAWTTPTPRHDFLNVRVRMKAGGTPPSDPLGGDGSTLVVDSTALGSVVYHQTGIAPGLTSWSAWAGFDSINTTPTSVSDRAPLVSFSATVT